MLVLTRKAGRALSLAVIYASPYQLQGRQVRLGIGAPSDVSVHREVYERIREENELAAGADKQLKSLSQAFKSRWEITYSGRHGRSRIRLQRLKLSIYRLPCPKRVLSFDTAYAALPAIAHAAMQLI